MNKNLTKRQNEIYQYLIEQSQESDIAPSIDDICLAMGLSSRGSMHKHIQALINAGLVAPFNGQRRGVRLVENVLSEAESVTLPLLGKIAAGIPLEAMENAEPINIPLQLYNGGECYVLEVNGDSMIDAGIFDGDYVVIEKVSNVKNNDIVVALIDNDEATLKRLEKKSNKIILHPENKNMQPMEFKPKQVQIQGRLVAQMRRYF